MKNKVAVILPYYGKFPTWFDLFIESAGCNRDFDFLIFTDGDLKTNFENIKVERTDFDWFRNKLQAVIDIPIVLDTPYKLCDFKPAYGQALRDYINGYNFWGYCDSDIILGDLSHFINDDILDAHDRIYFLGHFCLYRNCEKMNHLYMLKHNYRDCFSYKYVYTTNFVCAYDEVGTKYGYGLSEICRRKKFREYRSIDFADIAPESYNFVVSYINQPEASSYLYFEWGGVLIGYTENGLTKEFSYIHLQKRSMSVTEDIDNGRYFISPCAFRSTKNEALSDAKNIANKKAFVRKRKMEAPKRKLGKLKRGALKVLLDRRFGRINI